MNNSTWEKGLNNITTGEVKKTTLENISAWEKKNFYQRLGVDINSSDDQIKDAFKKLSLQYHPDRITGNDELKLNYQEIQKLLSEAKSTLLNVVNKEKYNLKYGLYTVNNHSRSYPSSFSMHGFEDEFSDTSTNEWESPKTPAEKIQFFVLIVKEGLDYGDKDGLLGVMDELIQEEGIAKKDIIDALEKEAAPYFQEYVRHNLGNPYEEQKIIRMHDMLLSLGVRSEKVDF